MPKPPEIEIAGRRIGPEHPPYVICELSGNHNGSLERALTMVDAAADTGCDAIKIQTYTADTITMDVDRRSSASTAGSGTGAASTSSTRRPTPRSNGTQALFERAAKTGRDDLLKPFDETAVDLLAGLGAPAYKIASFEAVDLR
jgi:N-acetylneuraminate synthase